MKSAAVAHLESLLNRKQLDHTLLKPWQSDAPTRVVPTGLTGLDQALGGGWRQGEVSELVGPPSSGLTSVLVATLAAVTALGGLAAVVDTLDRFDPTTAAEAGCDLDRVLWVRGPGLAATARPDVIGRAVHQAVRACDLIVRAGGFALVALDVADVPSRHLRALPSATWLRLARVNEGQKTACVLAGPLPLGRSARGVTVRLSASCCWTGASVQSRRLSGFAVEATILASHIVHEAFPLFGRPAGMPGDGDGVPA